MCYSSYLSIKETWQTREQLDGATRYKQLCSRCQTVTELPLLACTSGDPLDRLLVGSCAS